MFGLVGRRAGTGAADAPATAAVTGTQGVMTPPRRRRLISREIASDLAAALTVLIVTGAAFAATPLADWGKVIDGETVASDPMILISLGFLTGIVYAEALRQGGYFRFDQLLSTWGSIRGIVGRWILTLLAFIFLLYAFGASLEVSRPFLFAWGLLSAGGLIVGRFLTAGVLGRLAHEGRSLCRKVMVVGEGDLADRFIAKAQERGSDLLIVGQVSADAVAVPGQGGIESAKALLEAERLDDVIVCLPNEDRQRINHILHRLSALPVHIAMCPDSMWLDRGVAQVSAMGNLPLLTVHRRPIQGWGYLIKMLEDKVLGSLAFLMALPIMLVCAIAVRLDSPGPIFFIQNRQGFAGEIFPIVKFRTMRVMENGDQVKQATRNDDRITRVGRILRRYSLDELPQLWNVLRGDMSLVGPRPHAIAHDRYYVEVIDDYASRHKVKPGITGWAQVNGFRGETPDDETMAARIRYDIAYIENWSLGFDLNILVRTALAVILPKNAY